jgi:hypothetical protein
MALWTDEYLVSLRDQGETVLSTETKCIVARIPLEIISGQSEYDLPTNVSQLISIRYKGYKVAPYSAESGRLESTEVSPIATSTGRPLYYVAHEYGQSRIKLFPTPNESLTTDSSTINTKSGIEAQCIVTAYMAADVSGTDYRIPEYFKRRVIKYYIMYRAYAKEGKSQDLKARDYYLQKWEMMKSEIQKLVDEIPRAVHNAIEPQPNYSYRPATPRLPSNFGRIER